MNNLFSSVEIKINDCVSTVDYEGVKNEWEITMINHFKEHSRLYELFINEGHEELEVMNMMKSKLKEYELAFDDLYYFYDTVIVGNRGCSFGDDNFLLKIFDALHFFQYPMTKENYLAFIGRVLIKNNHPRLTYENRIKLLQFGYLAEVLVEYVGEPNFIYNGYSINQTLRLLFDAGVKYNKVFMDSGADFGCCLELYENLDELIIDIDILYKDGNDPRLIDLTMVFNFVKTANIKKLILYKENEL